MPSGSPLRTLQANVGQRRWEHRLRGKRSAMRCAWHGPSMTCRRASIAGRFPARRAWIPPVGFYKRLYTKGGVLRFRGHIGSVYAWLQRWKLSAQQHLAISEGNERFVDLCCVALAANGRSKVDREVWASRRKECPALRPVGIGQRGEALLGRVFALAARRAWWADCDQVAGSVRCDRRVSWRETTSHMIAVRSLQRPLRYRDSGKSGGFL
jgi:hypothetical protein